jgi:CheY-like chemotaxis protein
MKKKLTVLLAEDDPRDLDLFTHALQRDGVIVDVQRVHDGEEAIEYLQGRGAFADRATYPFPDIILVDLKMPKVSGLDVLEWRKKHPECARVPLIMFSGSGLQKEINAAYRLGANSYFSKPNTFQELRETLKTILHYWSRAELPESPVGQRCG